MSNVFSPGGRRRIYQPPQQPVRANISQSALDQYEKLAAFYQELLARYEEQTKALEEQAAALQAKTQELEIKNEALQRQSADMRQIEGDLLWTRVALEQAEKELEAAKAENWQERYQELQAELETLRKRWEVRYTNEVNEARNRILADMLPLADHLDLALQHIDGADAEGTGSFVSNIEATRRAFLETLKRYGVERLEAQGQPFDPTRHEAIAYIDDAQTPAEHVAQVVQAGYVEGERLLRPARVVVSRG
jgi:molecular chaperone GrpE